MNFSTYQQPVVSGDCKHNETKKLWANIEPHLKKCLATVHLREVTSKQMMTMEQDQIKEELNSIQSLSSIGRDFMPVIGQLLLMLKKGGFLVSYLIDSIN